MILKFSKRHHLAKLHDELLAAVPALRPQPGPDGVPVARLLLSGDGENIEAIVPDDLSPQDIDTIKAVVNAHDPTPPSPPPPDTDQQLLEAIAQADPQELKEALLRVLGEADVTARVAQG